MLANSIVNCCPSVEEIAAQSDISLSTVYRIIRGTSRIRTGKHMKAKKLLLEAGHIKSEKKDSLSLLCPFVDAYKYSLMLYKLINQEVLKREINLLQCAPEKLNEFLAGNNVDGIISFTHIENTSVPHVAINCDSILPAFSSVCCDEKLAMGMLFEYLLAKGHKRIGFFDDYALSSDLYSQRRCTGLIPYYYFAAGAEYRPEFVYSERVMQDRHVPVIKRAVKHFLSLPERPTAIILPADCYAICFYDELKMSGLRIPEDISITGFDNDKLAEFLHPPLTTIRKPFEKMVETAINFLIEKIKTSDNSVTRILLRPELIVRDSVADLSE
jgi:DNA-binding LacI/PurR family transcriptional regulator